MASAVGLLPARYLPAALTALVPRGLELRTLRLLAVRSNQLSYETIECKVGYSPHDRIARLFASQEVGMTLCPSG